MPDLSVSIVPKTGGGYEFEPNSLPGPALTGVSWNNTTGIPHQIRLTDVNGTFETAEILPGQGSSPLYVVASAGPTGPTIPYECALHSGEVGSIYVSAEINMNPEDGP
ncbi:MAG TPA: hypothetical protein VJ032_09290 [Thermoanaerobaculia bacterium]|nr:hypothetical protein [Thermoanaerobaculia bacterium]